MIVKKGMMVITALMVVMLLMAQTKPSASSKETIMANGSKVYKMYCLACHQADGGGVPHLNPPLINTAFVLGDKKDLVEIIIKGKKEPVEIDGEVYNNPMPPQVLLNDQQIADVLSYVRNSFGNKASMVSVAEVKKVRAALK